MASESVVPDGHEQVLGDRFNEAEANWPRNRDAGRIAGADRAASMRPRPIGLGILALHR